MTSLFSTLLGAILLGACIGSFLNVCISRWKNGGNIFFPTSSWCPHCHHSIPWHDNIPVLSFIFLKAKCRFCNKSISWQYPLVEASTALLFGLSFYRFHGLCSLLSSFFFVCFMILLTASDLKWKLLPHPFTNLFILTGLFFLSLNYFQPDTWFFAISNFLVLGFFLYGIVQIIPQGLGGGDIKLGAGLAIWLSLSKTFVILLLAFGLGTLMVVPLLWLKKMSKKSTIPFGPFLAFGSLLIWFWPGLMKGLGVSP